MRRRRLLALLGLLMLMAAAALAVLPARWLMLALPSHWPVAIVEASGTVWSGSATVALGPSHNRRTLPDPLHWTWSFAKGPQVEVLHPWLGGPLTLAATFKGGVISAQTLQAPATTLAALDARLAAVDPGGTLWLSWPRLEIGAWTHNAGQRLLDAEWRAASSALTPVRPLGHYALGLRQGAGNSAELLLETRRGPLLLEGRGSMDTSAGFRFQGTARADPAAGPEIQAALQDVLGALGPRRNEVTLLHYR